MKNKVLWLLVIFIIGCEKTSGSISAPIESPSINSPDTDTDSDIPDCKDLPKYHDCDKIGHKIGQNKMPHYCPHLNIFCKK